MSHRKLKKIIESLVARSLQESYGDEGEGYYTVEALIGPSRDAFNEKGHTVLDEDQYEEVEITFTFTYEHLPAEKESWDAPGYGESVKLYGVSFEDPSSGKELGLDLQDVIRGYNVGWGRPRDNTPFALITLPDGRVLNFDKPEEWQVVDSVSSSRHDY
jgi:hypothetical protein